MITLSDAGIFWIVSDDKVQQKLLNWSIQLAKRYYPELPRCVATSDQSLSCDARVVYFRPEREPHHESMYRLSLSPFDRTFYLCSRSMVLGRFEHLLHDTHFESSVNPIEDHKWLDYEVRPMNYFISYSKKGISKFDDWLSNQKDEWVTGQPCHILTEWHRFSKYVLNDQLVVDSESTKRKWAKHFNLQSRHEFCGITIPLWFRFPIIDLDQDFNLFYELILRDDSKT